MYILNYPEAPAFWQFATKAEAIQAASDQKRQTKKEVSIYYRYPNDFVILLIVI